MKGDQAFPVTLPARASDAGLRYLRRIVDFDQDHLDASRIGSYMFLAHSRMRLVEALEYRLMLERQGYSYPWFAPGRLFGLPLFRETPPFLTIRTLDI